MDHRLPSAKINRVLHIILVAFLLIAFQIWHLGVVQREEKVREAQKPKHRTIFLRADRGLICDRFHIPLAMNRICYNAAIYYGQISQIPAIAWTSDERGTRIRSYPRKEHIKELSTILGQILDLDSKRIEDLIYSKASLLPHVPYVLKSGLTEKEYYRLKMLEKDWLGVSAEIGTERHYPFGKTACHLIGSLGSISQKKYESITQEIGTLQEAIDTYENQGIEILLPQGYDSFDTIYKRLYELKEKAYTINDRVGTSGVEGKYEEDLRGFWGLKKFEVDQKGKAFRELLGGKTPIPGQDIVLSISIELQKFAEELLIQNEKERVGRSLGIDPADKIRKVQKQPWIKGGAIVAIDPNTGEVLAFASHPRFDPNDFVGSNKQSHICRWLENERFVSDVWNGEEVLVREWPMGKKIGEEKEALTWEFYLDQILPSEGPLRNFFSRANDLKNAIHLQEDFEALLYFSQSVEPLALINEIFSKGPLYESLRSNKEAEPHLRRLESFLGPIPSNEDKLFALDLLRMAVCSPRFGDDLLLKISTMKLNTYWSLSQAFHRFEKKIFKELQKEFHANEFLSWRENHQKEFLAKKRKEEKEKKTYARPYMDYLDRKEKELFSSYWQTIRYTLLEEKINDKTTDSDRRSLYEIITELPQNLKEEFLRTFRSFQELDRPLYSKKNQTEKDLAAAFYPQGGYGFSRSSAFQTSAPQGSLFKLIASYEGLRQGHHFSLIDELRRDASGKNLIVGCSLNKTPYPRLYKGGRLPRSSSRQIGEIDLIGAIEHSSNPYFSILAGDFLKNPEDLNTAARLFGLGEKSGIELAGETAGNLPSDLKINRTGLYSYAIGQHTLLATPLQSALMLSTLANKGYLLKPKIVKEAIGLSAAKEPFSRENRFAKAELNALGIHFPLFTAVQLRTSLPSAAESLIEIKHFFPLPASIRNPILEGMDRSIWSGKGSARPASIRSLHLNPALMREYNSLQHQMVGKTSTAEILFNPNINPSSQPQIYKHVSFGAISFDSNPLACVKTRWENPDLVVVVFLRFGSAGKDAAPIVAQIIHKWREICKKHE